MKITFSKAAKQKLQRLGVDVVYLIGSRALGLQRPNSDFDLAVVMHNPSKLQKHELKMYDELYKIFSATLPKIPVASPYPYNIINIDIIFLQKAPLYYALEAAKNGKILFEISAQLRTAFEEKNIQEYADIEPLLKSHEQVILAAI